MNAKRIRPQIYIPCVDCESWRLVRISSSKARYMLNHPRCASCASRRSSRKKRDGHRSKSKAGYINIKVGIDHPLADTSGWIAEHWLVWWNANGQKSRLADLRNQGFSIHHKNGIRDDNRITNLELMIPGRHPNGWKLSDLRQLIKLIDDVR